MNVERASPSQFGHFRRQARTGRRVSVHYSLVERGETRPMGRAYTTNIGVGGAFIATADPPPPGTHLVLQIAVPPTGRIIEVQGDVRWIADTELDAVHGMGVRFRGLDEEQLLVLNDYFAALTATLDHDGG